MNEQKTTAIPDPIPTRRGPRDLQFSMGLLALLVAFGTAVVSYMQYRSAEKAIRTAHADSVATLKLSYRPYVGVQGSTPGKANLQGYMVTLHFTAIGASPALGVAIKRGCRFAELGAQRGEIDPPAELWQHLGSAAGHPDLFPGNSIDYHCLVRPAEDGVITYLFTVGEVSYSDVFGDAHKTTFCLETVPDVSSPTPMVMLPCTNGNRMQ